MNILKDSINILKNHFIFSFIFSLIYYKISKIDRNAFIFPYSSDMGEYSNFEYHDFLFLAFNIQSVQGTNEVNIQSKTAQIFVTIQIITTLINVVNILKKFIKKKKKKN